MSRYGLPGLPFLVALLTVLLAGKPTIAWLASKKAKQPISPDAPEKHRLKHGTPTMGGLLLLGGVGVALTAALIAFPMVTHQRERLGAVLAVYLFGGLIGLIDDVGKARKKENKAGLSERAKLVLQLVVASGFGWFLSGGFGMFDRQPTIVLGFDLGPAFVPLAVLYVMGFANAVNFTDGLDGLSSGTTLIASGALALATLESAVRPEVAIFYGALAGACAGFLWWNAYPARVFMGDTGSLALGMGLAAAAIVARQEVLLLVIGAVYLAEIASMMLQRYVFKYRRIRYGIEYAKANRVFRRAPLHHHFEELGWHETQVVLRFWVAALFAAAIGLVSMGTRP